MKPDLIEVCNLFCAICCQIDPSLPLIHHTKSGSFVFANVCDELLALLHNLAFNNLDLYRRLAQAEGKDRQLLQLDVINLLWTECKDYIK